MPSGNHGCFVCGEPTCAIVVLRMEDYKSEKYASGNRKRSLIATEARSFCDDCSIDVWEALVEKLGRTAPLPSTREPT